MPLEIGRTINNRYYIRGLVSSVNDRQVYLVYDHQDHMDCRLIERDQFTPEGWGLFNREADILARLWSTNLPKLVDRFILKGQGWYLVTRPFLGEHLLGRLKNRPAPFPESEAVRWAIELCRAVVTLHGMSPPVVHRDIKPGNIAIDKDGRLILENFNLAFPYESNPSKPLSDPQLGTPGFAPPEQYDGRPELRSDIYAIGASLYTLLTQTVVQPGIDRLLGAPLIPIREINPAVSPQVATAIERALALDVNKRVQTVQELIIDLTGAGHVATVSPSASATTTSPTPVTSPNPDTGYPFPAPQPYIPQPTTARPPDSEPLPSPFRQIPKDQAYSNDTGPRGSWREELRPAPPARLAPAEEIIFQRYTRIGFPLSCVQGHSVVLNIQLTKKVSLDNRALHKVTLRADASQGSIQLTVLVTAPGFQIQESEKVLQVPLKKDSPQIQFVLIPQRLGDQVVEMEFFQDRTRVGHVLVATQVSAEKNARREQSKAAKINLVRDPGENLAIERDAIDSRRLVLHVTTDERNGRLVFRLPQVAPRQTWVSPLTAAQSQISAALKNLDGYLDEIARARTMNDATWASVCFNMQAYGMTLYRHILPPGSLADYLAKLPPGFKLIISTDEQWVPWELLYDGTDYWSRRYILARYPRPANQLFPEPAENPGRVQNLQIAPPKIVNVVGGSLSAEITQRAGQIFDGMATAAQVQTLRAVTVAELAQALPADILNCTCHGQLEPHLLQISADSSRMVNLPPETVAMLPFKPGCLVFANACASAAPQLFFGCFQNFGWQFYLRGAGAFVGTLGPVPALQAVKFAETLYAALFNPSARMTIGEALAHTRETLQQERNLFWLMYCLIGDPDYKLPL